MVKEQTIGAFLAQLSSKAPVPGGGGASAIGGAMGNALGQMVANLTVGKRSTPRQRMRFSFLRRGWRLCRRILRI